MAAAVAVVEVAAAVGAGASRSWWTSGTTPLQNRYIHMPRIRAVWLFRCGAVCVCRSLQADDEKVVRTNDDDETILLSISEVRWMAASNPGC